MSTTSQVTTFIYALCDPITNQVRYVGKANRPSVRKYEHVTTAQLRKKTHKNHWIKGLLAIGSRPEMCVIEEVPIEDWQQEEMFWISYFKYIGADLTNSTGGGEGGVTADGIAKQAAALRGRTVVRSAEHARKIAEVNKARAKDPEWIKKITASAKKRAENSKAILMARLESAWKAQRTKRYDVACRSCGSLFVANNTRKIFCGATCAHRERKRAIRSSGVAEARR